MHGILQDLYSVLEKKPEGEGETSVCHPIIDGSQVIKSSLSSNQLREI